MQTKRYWLRGGVISATIVLIVYAVVIAAGYNYCFGLNPPAGEALGCAVLAMVIAGPFVVKIKVLALFLVYLIIGFIVGAVLGWLYGKIKNRKQQPQI